MLTCVIDATKKRDVAVVDIPNAFIQTVVADEKDRAFICIRGPLVDILGPVAPDVYGPYVTVGKKGEKQLLVQCLTALYGTMVALLLYYKKFVKSLKLNGFRFNPYDPCVANKQVKGEQLTVCVFTWLIARFCILFLRLLTRQLSGFDRNMRVCLKMVPVR
jgi:hypothetical protein